MHSRIVTMITTTLLLIAIPIATPSYAGSLDAPRQAGSAYDLISAVNALRSTNGLPAYSFSSILMYTAQNQADFMAANGIVTHTGPGGIGLTDRLLAAGYPLAGDISLGGFRAENIISGTEDMSAGSVVDAWTGDAPHLNTMLSPYLTEIGAGVAVADGRVYYVIDAALPKGGGAPQLVTTVVGGGSSVPPSEALISSVVVSTPNPNGDVVHEVLSGQTLWQIAVSYDVKVDDIKRLNNISDNNIYPGDKLLIKNVAPTVVPTLIMTRLPVEPASPTVQASPIPAVIKETIAPIPTITAIPKSGNNSATTSVAIGIIALALLCGGIFIRLGSPGLE